MLVDEEGLEVLKSHNIYPNNYYLINDDASIYRFITKAFGIKEVKVLQVGLDVGRRLAYAILCDNLLLKAGYISRPKDLIETVVRFRDYLMPDKVVVKLGNSSGVLSQKLETLLKDLILFGFEVVVADESNSSAKVWNTLMGYKTRFTTDIHAALNIAFREGVKVSKV
ncbi:MAG: hypothetical protein RMH77_06665 [Sulfolobales archaeon]|nr:hypothetical protein [Sulfolobales archaeon]MCX8185732.1 hypothetical protein [Sulfolobales archaeon]MDW7970060.1 hypothetical protein [Sulfolobales archaeon]